MKAIITHGVDRFTQFGTATFVNTACIDPDVAASTPFSNTAAFFVFAVASLVLLVPLFDVVLIVDFVFPSTMT